MVNLKSGAIRTAIGLARARLETHIQTADMLLSKALPGDKSILPAHLQETEVLVDKLEAAISTLSEKDEKWLSVIENIDPETEAELLTAEETKYQSVAADGETGKPAYLNVLADAKEALAQLKRRACDGKSKSGSTVNSKFNSNATALASSHHKSAKLPKLSLPTFSGDPLEWHQFYTIFKANIGDADLTPVEKLSYLRGQLTGDAKLAVDGLEITNDSYGIAIGMLTSRFERQPAQIINQLYSQFKKIKPLSDRSTELRRTHDQTEKIFRQLKAHGEDVDSNHSLVSEILTKYPKFVVKELTQRYNVTAESSATDTQAALFKFLKDTDLLSELFDGLHPYNEGHKSYFGNKAQPDSFKNLKEQSSIMPHKNETSALTASEKSKSFKPPTPCQFCEGNHFNSECDRYATAETRRKRLEAVNRCSRCFSRTHQAIDCRTKTYGLKCFYCKSTGHKSALCSEKFPNKKKTDATTVTLAGDKTKSISSKSREASTSKTTVSLSFGEKSLLSTAVTNICNSIDGTETRVRIVLDSGSHRSYVTEGLVKQLNAKVTNDENLQVAVFGSKRQVNVKTGRIQLKLSTRDDCGSIPIWFNTTPIITDCNLLHGTLPDSVQRQVEALKYAMADDFDADLGPPQVLIGSDYFWQLIKGASMPLCDGIYFIPTAFGLILGGRYQSDDCKDNTTLLCLTERSNTHTLVSTIMDTMSQATRCNLPYPDVDKFWSLEKIGICDEPADDDDAKAQEQFDHTVRFQDGRYQVCWPWNDLHKQLPTNYQLTLGRFRSLVRRLATSDKSIVDEYSKVISTQEQLGIIEKVPINEINNTENLVHYLPHHPVVKMTHATTKVRIVYDASARCGKHNVSLNECMYRGPVILPDLCSILLRFRTQPIAIVADIEKAFLQLSLQKTQRDVTRFLWFKNPNAPNRSEFSVLRFTRVPFGVISSPFLLGATIQHHLKRTGTSIALKIRDDVYVDNVISGTNSEEEAVQFYKEAKQVFSNASMNIREWCSSSKELLSFIPKADKCSSHIVKVLGLQWDSQEDQLRVQCDWKSHFSCGSKREVLKSIASIYDPLGLFQPCTLRVKCFLRKLWLDQLEWDDPLAQNLREEWTRLQSEISPIFDYDIPRKIDTALDEKTSLVVFSDASADAYATAVYLRAPVSSDSNSYKVNLIYAKSKLAPISAKTITIPRLELLGLTIAASVTQFIRKSLNLPQQTKTYLLTDSMVVLGWLQSDQPLPVFVANRIKRIATLETVSFYHVSGKDNPADLATRGMTGREICNSTLWWSGPTWLQSDQSTWPTSNEFSPEESTYRLEETISTPIFHTILAGEGPAEATKKYPLNINPKNYSSFRKLIRVTVICLKFLKQRFWAKLSVTTQGKYSLLPRIFDSASPTPIVTSNELAIAKQLWVKYVQQNLYRDIINAINNQKPNQLVKQLDLKLDEHGILRCYGRLKFADLSYEALQPTLLPKNDFVTSLIIKQAHEKLFDSGVSHTLNQIRREYWIPHGRNAVRKIINQCVLCHKSKGPPFALPKMPPWPRERVARSAPFQFSGVDYFGPINDKCRCQ